jgi:hypothetical protein
MKTLSLSFMLLLFLAGAAAGQENANTPAAESHGVQVAVVDNTLNVDLKDAPFREVMEKIAYQAGFDLMLTGSVSERKLNTRFSGIGLERGIMRLFTLVKHKNYFIHYDDEGNITQLEIFSPGESEVRKAPARVAPSPVRRPPVPRKDFKLPDEPEPGVRFPKRLEPKKITEEEILELDVPYIPPAVEPEYIPPSEN